MHESRLIKMFQTLSNEEFRQFKRFVQSPFFNTNENLVQLYDYINKYYPNWNSRMLSKAHAFRHLFPNAGAFQPKKIGNLMSELSLLVEEYLVQLELKHNRVEKKKLKIDAFGKKNLYDFFTKNLAALEQELEAMPHKDLNYYYETLSLNQKLYYHQSTSKFNISIKSLPLAMQNLDQFYTLAKLRFACEMKAREFILPEKHGITLLKEASELSRENDHYDNPLFKIFYTLLRLIKSNQPEYYWEIKSLFFDEIDSLKKQDQLFILQYLLNFTVYQINKGNQKFLKENHDFYKFGLKKGLLIHQKIMTDSTFYNIVAAGVRLKQYTWTEEFIFEFQTFLKEDIRADVTTICFVLINYAKKNFTECRNLLISHSFKHINHKLRAKSLLLRAIFEELKVDKSQYGLFISQSLSFEKFLKRNNKISSSRADTYLEFIKLIRMIGKYHHQGKTEPHQVSKLKQRLENNGAIANKFWISEKVNELL